MLGGGKKIKCSVYYNSPDADFLSPEVTAAVLSQGFAELC